MRILVSTVAAVALAFAGTSVALADTVVQPAPQSTCAAPHAINILTCVSVLDEGLLGDAA